MKNSFNIRNILFYVLVLLLFSGSVISQTDTTFWFAVPYVTDEHHGPAASYLRLTSAGKAAEVTIIQPHNPQIAPINVSLLPGETKSVYFNKDDFDKISGDNYNMVTNYALLVQSTEEITAYYELTRHKNDFEGRNYNNPDIFALKGKNALGRDFWVPFQTQWNNRGYDRDYSQIVIVATEDNTEVNVTTSKDAVGFTADDERTIILNKGETFMVVPKIRDGRPSKYATDRLAGTHITSNKPIAVTIGDDSVRKGGWDYIGDQLIPIKNIKNQRLVGKEYLVMRGEVSDQGGGSTEKAFVLTTEDHTNITVVRPDGTSDTYYDYPAGIQHAVDIPTDENYVYILASAPVYVLHISGFGTELGGAILPSIEGCTGSLTVSFVRSKSQPFYLNLMARGNAIDSFYLDNGPGADLLIDTSFFEPVPNTEWYVLKDNNTVDNFFENNVNTGTVTRVYNTMNVFHLGIINGVPSGGGCIYGYFSDYNELESEVGVGGQGGVFQGCDVDSVRLKASGGLRYLWSPAEYLDDPYAEEPMAYPPKGIAVFKVNITRPCYGDTTMYVTLFLPESPYAYMSLNLDRGCSPLEIAIEDAHTDSTNVLDWGDGSPLLTGKDFKGATHTYTNTSDTAVEYPLELAVSNIHGCNSIYHDTVTVYPEIEADIALKDPNDMIGCHPLQVEFDNQSSGHLDRWEWDFADGSNSNDSIPVHVFNNYGENDTTYKVDFTAISPVPYNCTSRDSIEITVHPYVKAGLTMDNTKGCSPLNVSFDNTSSVGVDTYEWYLGADSFNSSSDTTFTKTFSDLTYPDPDTLNVDFIVSNEQGCYDSIMNKTIIVYPEANADFTLSSNEICDSMRVDFQNNSNGFNMEYLWEFGDDNSSNQENTSHIFRNTTNGNIEYPVSLYVSSTYCFDYHYDTVLVHPSVKADFTYDVISQCTPMDVQLNPGNSKSDTLYWDFNGDQITDSVLNDHLSFVKTFDNQNITDNIVYDIRLVTSNWGCSDTMIRSLEVYPEVRTEIETLSDVSGCSPLKVSFNNLSKGGDLNFKWDFGDGLSSSDSVPAEHTYSNLTRNEKTYNVWLRSFNPETSCSSEDSVNILVYPQVNSAFTKSAPELCTPFEVEFTNNSSKVTDEVYTWTFGDGDVSTGSDVSHIYRNTNKTEIVDYPVSLHTYLENHPECEAFSYDTVTVYPEVKAIFTPDEPSGCHPFEVEFSNQSSGNGLNYDWDFDNGDGSTGAEPVNIYENWSSTDRTYNVTLTVKDANNCIDDTVVSVVAHPFVDAAFSFEKLNFCTPLDVRFDPENTRGNTFLWDFEGDGTMDENRTGNSPFNHEYTSLSANDDVNYSPRVTVYYDFAPQCRDSVAKNIVIPPVVKASFTPGVMEGCHPLEMSFTNHSTGGDLSYDWDFGDNTSSGEKNIEHIFYNYSGNDIDVPVQLKVSSENTCTDDTTVNITVFAFIEADFKVDDAAHCSPFTIQPENTSEGGVDNYDWDFGDGATSFIPNPSHTYKNTSGEVQERIIKLIVKNAHECYDSASHFVQVYPEVEPEFQLETEGCHPLDVNFINKSLYAKDFTWDFGDGSTSGKNNVTHRYFNFSRNKDSLYRVRLTAVSQYDCISHRDTTITVHPKPISQFDFAQSIGCPPFEVDFVNNSVGNEMSYLWFFDDGLPSSQESPSYTFYNKENDIKDYEITLRVSTVHNCMDTSKKIIRVYPEVLTRFEMDQDSGCSPLEVKFTNYSENEDFYEWYFDDGLYSSVAAPLHRFVNNGKEDREFVVSLTTRSDYNCLSVYKDTIEIFPSPSTEFSVTPTHQIYEPEPEVTLNNWSNHLDLWKFTWDFGDGSTSGSREGIFKKTYTIWGDVDNDSEIPIKLTAENQNHPQCNATVTHNIRIIPPLPEIDILGEEPKGCVPLEVDFSTAYNYVHPDGFVWDFDDGGGSEKPSPVYVFEEPGIYNVKLQVKGDGGVNYDYKTVEVYRLPEVEFVIEPDIIMLPDEEIQCYNQSKFGIEYLWDFGDGYTSIEKEPSHLYSLEDHPDPPYFRDIKLKVWTEHGCVDSLTEYRAVKIDGTGVIKFPNAFTPNLSGPLGGDYNPNDVSNQIFRPHSEGVVEYHLEVYTRWGELIFVSDDVNIGWDGYYKGKLMGQGVYIWKVWGKYTNGKEFVKAGDVTILHNSDQSVFPE